MTMTKKKNRICYRLELDRKLKILIGIQQMRIRNMAEINMKNNRKMKME
jgi:hypothetical protein